MIKFVLVITLSLTSVTYVYGEDISTASFDLKPKKAITLSKPLKCASIVTTSVIANLDSTQKIDAKIAKYENETLKLVLNGKILSVSFSGEPTYYKVSFQKNDLFMAVHTDDGYPNTESITLELKSGLGVYSTNRFYFENQPPTGNVMYLQCTN